MREVYTTGQIAKLIGCAPRSVTKHCDAGKIECYKFNNDRRITRESLKSFLRKNRMPQLAKLEAEEIRSVICTGVSRVLLEAIRGESHGMAVEYYGVDTPFEAGAIAAKMSPDVLVVDSSVGRDAAVGLCRGIRKIKAHDYSLLIYIASEDDGEAASLNFGEYFVVFRHPFDSSLLAEMIRSFIESKTYGRLDEWRSSAVTQSFTQHV